MDALESDATAVIHLDRVERWNAYKRLQELGIDCRCDHGQPLQVQAKTPTDVIQIWSVTHALTRSRQDEIDRLNRCWRQASHR